MGSAAVAADPMPSSDVVMLPAPERVPAQVIVRLTAPDAPRHPVIQFNRAEDFFQTFDLNRDGVVNPTEMQQTIALKLRQESGGSSSLSLVQFLQIRGGSADDEQRFRQLDKNGDGQLTGNELESRGAALFNHLDRNKDGVITRDEMGPPPRRVADSRPSSMNAQD